MATSGPKHWKTALQETARSPRIGAHIVGLSRIHLEQHAALVKSALLAFGDNPRATFFIDGLSAEGDLPRPDLMILHPDIGVLVIENKGMPLDQIHALTNHLFRLIRNGVLKEEDPFHQAERVMFALRDLCKTRMNLDEALFLRTVAFPRIRRRELELRFDQAFPPKRSSTMHAMTRQNSNPRCWPTPTPPAGPPAKRIASRATPTTRS